MPDPIGGKEAMRQSTRALISVVICACCAQQLSAAESGKSWWPFGKKDEAKAAQPIGAGATSQAQQTNLPAIANTPAATTAANPLAVAPPAANAPIVPHGAATPSAVAPGPAAANMPLAHEADLSATADAEKKERWMLNSPKGKVSWPHLNKDLSKGGPIFQSKKKEKEEDPTRNSWVEKTPAPPKQSPMKPLSDGAHKFSTGTKSAWNKTVDALTPGDDKEKVKAPTPRIAKREIQPPFWKRMFGAKSELQQPQTVPEWMAQQRLDP